MNPSLRVNTGYTYFTPFHIALDSPVFYQAWESSFFIISNKNNRGFVHYILSLRDNP